MMLEATLQKLHDLRLAEMAAGLRDQQASPTLYAELSFEECLAPLADRERRDLPEVLEDRHDVSSTIVSSQLPIEQWHDIMANPTIADAVCDRLLHNSHKLMLKGESMRKITSKLT